MWFIQWRAAAVDALAVKKNEDKKGSNYLTPLG
jgi:hypothetical protein